MHMRCELFSLFLVATVFFRQNESFNFSQYENQIFAFFTFNQDENHIFAFCSMVSNDKGSYRDTHETIHT